MPKYLARRLLIAIPTLVGVTLVIFIAMRVLPGDPLAMISGEGAGSYVLSKEQLAAARASLGLDRPYYVQYLRSEEHTSELQSLRHLVCRLLLEKKKKT